MLNKCNTRHVLVNILFCYIFEISHQLRKIAFCSRALCLTRKCNNTDMRLITIMPTISNRKMSSRAPYEIFIMAIL